MGDNFSFALNEAATVRLAFTKPAPGRKVRGRCVAPSRHNAHARKCTRTVSAGALTLSGHAGADRVHFEGRLVHGSLRPGTYTLVITATNASGRSSAPQRLSFTIVRG